MRACETKKGDNGYCNLTLSCYFEATLFLAFDLYPPHVYYQSALCCYIFNNYNHSVIS